MSSTVPPPRISTTSKVDPLVGTVVNGKFQIVSLVASGGMGRIYKGEQIALGRPVALKVLHSTQGAGAATSDDPYFKKRFFREASILARLQHPNIVTVFDYGAIEGLEERYFMAMEFLSGPTLSKRIADRTFLSPKETVRIARQLARGLVEAHGHGVIHRDLKPSNVMLVSGRDGEELVKIVDFGIVKIMDEDVGDELTQEGSFIGSPKYMAPEQIERGGKVDARTDVYSFGIILYQCLAGSVPFDGASSIQTLMAHVNHAPQPLRQRAPNLDIPDWLQTIVMSCLEKSPEKRPQSMEGIAKALTEAEASFNTANRGLPAVGPVSTLVSAGTSSRNGGGGADVDGLGSAQTVLSAEASGPRPPARIASGITEQGTFSSVHPPLDKTPAPAPRAPERRALPRAVVAAAAFLITAVVLFFTLRRAVAPPPSSQASVPSPAPSALPAAVSATRREFALTIDSTPSGAEVREGSQMLGVTPLHLTIDNDGARLEPRHFVVTREGFAPYALEQGPSEESVRLVAPLVAVPAAVNSAVAAPSASAVSVAHATQAGRKPSAVPPKATSSAPSQPLDIRLTR